MQPLYYEGLVFRPGLGQRQSWEIHSANVGFTKIKQFHNENILIANVRSDLPIFYVALKTSRNAPNQAVRPGSTVQEIFFILVLNRHHAW